MSEPAFRPTSPVRDAPARGRAREGSRSRLEALLAPALLGAALVAVGGAALVLAASRIAPHPLGQALLSAVVCLSFVGAGVLALRERSYGRFGLLLAGVGFASLLGVLHDANGAVAYAIGVFGSNLVFAVLLHALLAFPTGRLGSRPRRLLAAAAYADVLVLQAVAVLFDPLTRYHSAHPRNLALLDARPGLATGLLELEAGIAIGLALTVAAVLTRRARAATPAARRQLVPVLWCGSGGLLIFALGLAAVPLSSGAGLAGMGVGLLAALALPGAFAAVVLQGRLSRAAVGDLLVELREGPEAGGLQGALRRALGDPSLELVRRPAGDRRDPADPSDGRVTTPVLHHGAPVGALIHDRSLRLRPELLDAVGAAAGFALANEDALEAVRRVEARNRALLDAIPDLMFRISRDGTYLDVTAHDTSGLLRPPEELLGINVRDVLPGDVADAVLACAERALETAGISAVEYDLTIGGVERCFESRMVPSGADEVVTIVRDFTERRRREAERRTLQDELHERLAELQASRARIVEAGEAERRRLERNLHDGAQQRLVALSLGLRLAEAKIDTAPADAKALIARAGDNLAEALTELRELARGLHPAVLTERGLEAALQVLAARAPLPVEIDVDLPERLPAAAETAAYYVVSESLANVVKHARAGAALVRVERVDGRALIEVADDGVGGADATAGSGLRGLRDRVETLAGALEVASSPGEGTRVRAEVPVA
jgi:signal transduction histidine kinase